MSKSIDAVSQDDKKTGKDNWNIIWNSFWLLIIFGLFVTISITMLIIYTSDQSSNIQSSSKNYLDKKFPENTTISCKGRKECQAIERKFQQIKDDIYRGDIEEIQLKIDNQDKIINSLTFSVSLYAVLITVISIFFSLRESQRIDKALDDINNFKEKLDNTLNRKYNEIDEKLSEIDEKLNEIDEKRSVIDEKLGEIDERLEKLNSKVDSFEGKYNEFVQELNGSFSENKDFIQHPVGRDMDISDEIKNDVLKNKTDENNKNKNEFIF
ncbi:hypothetical protein [Kingella oralis]|uniref:hypothetical protein n=1 Tax=Kingella oralis TaxID=505 RepID=UPI002D7F7DEC|nr:hypothetical protein [Kingella oralis]